MSAMHATVIQTRIANHGPQGDRHQLCCKRCMGLIFELRLAEYDHTMHLDQLSSGSSRSSIGIAGHAYYLKGSFNSHIPLPSLEGTAHEDGCGCTVAKKILYLRECIREKVWLSSSSAF